LNPASKTRTRSLGRKVEKGRGVAVSRGPGRPAGTGRGLFSRESIIAVSLALTRTVPLHEVSIVRVAQELEVTPGLIHYYMGGRDALTTGVMNAFYRELAGAWPEPRDGWRENLTAVCKALYDAHVKYGGIAAFLVSHNRFRLVQSVQPGETDYGILLFDRFMAAVKAAGFDAALTGTYGHLLNEFVTGYAQATAAHRWPGEHAGFLTEKLAALDSTRYPAAHFVSKPFTQLNAVKAFEMGLALFLDGLEQALASFLAKKARRRAVARR
jgi:AcrR family transcriptional regulator